ncbi:serine phosphatase RsbU (regulator of sigma subunit) [Desulfitispora alkaliphila]|uniref:PP2C family protein-serine/threonine phosphatase n=1 Tax=Desulfitispora alkaliphila TaxID=622674 RepID=UPI003D253F58
MVSGVALICDSNMQIRSVVYNGMENVLKIETGLHFFKLLDQGSLEKATNFIGELKQKRAAFNWEVNFKLGLGIKALYLSGSIIDSDYILVFVETQEDAYQFYEDLMNINSEHIVSVRAAFKETSKYMLESSYNKKVCDDLNVLNNELATMQREISKKNMELNRLYSKLNGELEKARILHQRSLPKQLPEKDGVKFTAHYQPAENLGGDFYNVINLGDKYIIYISDVSGHGIDSAMLTVFIKEAINSYLALSHDQEELLTPGRILRHLAVRARNENFPDDYFICILLGVYYQNTNEFVYSSMGMQVPPLMFSGKTGACELSSGNLPLSKAIEFDMFQFEEWSVSLEAPATLLLATDGLTEQFNKGVQYEERLKELFRREMSSPGSDLMEVIRRDFEDFTGGREVSDDITILLMQVDHKKTCAHE